MESVDNVDTSPIEKIAPVTDVIDLNEEEKASKVVVSKETNGINEAIKTNGTNGTNGFHHSDEEAEESPAGDVTDDTKAVEENMEKISLTENTEPAKETNEKPEPEEVVIPQSKSNEFTYTTFEVPRSDSEDNTASQQSEPAEDSVAQANQQEPEKQEEQEKKEAALPEKRTEQTKSSSACENKDMEIDAFLDKVKMGELNNKDVCNYMLNLLVSGEFDLEKNFIIQNVKSILNLVQVIKCAKQPSLKAELWSLFTAILRKSQLNLQACVEIGLIETALHELKAADSVCAELIIDMLTVLASYSVTVEELKAIFNQLRSIDKTWVGFKWSICQLRTK